MGYRELLRALEEEVSRKVAECRAEAARESARILEEAGSEASARRETTLADERRRLAEGAARALSAARLEQQRALLVETRGRLEELRGAAEGRLASLKDAELLARLVDEVAPELGEGPLVFRVEPGDEKQLERHLRQSHPELAVRASIEASPDLGGGVEIALLGARQRLDNTLRARLENAWRQLEPEIAARLFGARPEQTPPERPAQDEAALAASHAGDRDGPS